jgi:hypothetical protein
MNKIHGLNTDTTEHPSETARAIEEFHTRIMAILEQGKIARLERRHVMLDDCAVIKFLDSWTPCYDADDLVACAGIHASTLFVCPVYNYTITAVTREEMENELAEASPGGN